MEVKCLEIRDSGTFIPMLCVDMNPSDIPDGEASVSGWVRYEAQKYLLRRCGYPCDGKPNVAMTRLDAHNGACTNDPYAWGGRTFPVAHKYIIEQWDELVDGDVVDVEFILGETKEPKRSERKTVPL